MSTAVGMAASVGRALARPRVLFVLSIVGAALIWSTSYTATKVALTDIPPLTINALRFALAAILMLGIVLVVIVGVVLGLRSWTARGNEDAPNQKAKIVTQRTELESPEPVDSNPAPESERGREVKS